MKNPIWKSALPALFMLGAANLAHAGFIGRELSVLYAFPDLNTVYAQAIPSQQPFLVTDPGVDTTVDVEGVTTIAVDFKDQAMLIKFETTAINPRWNDVSFNGLVFTLVSGSPFALVNGIVDGSSTLAGFDASRIGLSDTQLTLNWKGLSYVDGTTLRIDFESARNVPEPTSLGLLCIGLVGVAAQRRRSSANSQS